MIDKIGKENTKLREQIKGLKVKVDLVEQDNRFHQKLLKKAQKKISSPEIVIEKNKSPLKIMNSPLQ